MSEKTKITVGTYVNVPIDKAWEYWTNPEHVRQWNQASEDWHTPHAESDLRTDGQFLYRMEAKDGSFGFDFGGKFTEVKQKELIAYTMDDDRKVKVTFTANGAVTIVEEVFEAESENPVDLQRQGWQAILDNFKKYAEAKFLAESAA